MIFIEGQEEELTRKDEGTEGRREKRKGRNKNQRENKNMNRYKWHIFQPERGVFAHVCRHITAVLGRSEK